MLLHIIAARQDVEDRWEHTRAIAFNIAKFGNSDPKKFPSSVRTFWPFEWDDEERETNDFQEAYRILRERKNMSSASK